MRLGERAKRTDQLAVRHAAGTGRFTSQASKAPVNVRLRALPWQIPFQHLFHQNNSPAWRIHLLAEFGIGWAGRQTEAAMHASLHRVCHRFAECAKFLSWY